MSCLGRASALAVLALALVASTPFLAAPASATQVCNLTLATCGVVCVYGALSCDDSVLCVFYGRLLDRVASIACTTIPPPGLREAA